MIDKAKMACNRPQRTPGHPTKSHVVKACSGGTEKIIRFGEQGAKTAGKPKAGESAAMKKKRASFKARHASNIAKGKMSAAWWADRVKWTIVPIGVTLLLSAGEADAQLQSQPDRDLPTVQSVARSAG